MDTKIALTLDEAAIARRVEAAQARVFVDRMYASALVSPLGILLVAWLILRVSGGTSAATWTVLITLAELLIIGLRSRHRLALAREQDGRVWVQALMAVAGLLGLIWGASVWFLWARAQFLVYIADLCLLVGVSGITMVVLSPLRWAGWLFSAGLLLPGLLHIVVTSNPIGVEIGVGWLVMVAVQAHYARELRRELVQQLDAPERNGALAGLLSQAGDNLQAANAQLAIKNTELERAMDKLNRLVTVDQLTGAYTRRYVFEQMERKASAKARHGTPLSVIMLDLDHFKAVNDRYGHPVGDRALQAVALAVTGQLRDGDILARVGGEEFLVLLPMTGQAAAMQLAERLRQTLAATTITEGTDRIALPASFGVAELQDGEELSAWYQRLDATLYKAKSQGRNALVAAA